MRFIAASVILAVFISGIKSEAEPLTGTLGGPIAGSGAYKDASVSAHDYIQAFHHGAGVGGQHGVGNGGGISEGSSQIQDQQSAGIGGVGIADQVPRGSAVPHHVISGGGAGVGGHYLSGSSVFPGPYVLQKSDVSGLHFGGRAIGSPPFPYYPSYYGKTYASPYYSQYQPNPYQAAVYQPQSFYPAPAYQYSGSPYSPTNSGGVGVGVGVVGAGGALPYSSSVTPYSAYPYNYPYIPQYYPGYPSAAASGSYYQSSGAEIQSASKQ